jgi:hypothetical protein
MNTITESESCYTMALTREGGFEAANALINGDKPYFIGRLSGNETLLCGKVLTNRGIDKDLLHAMSNNAGIKLNSRHDLNLYVDRYKKAVDNCTLLGVWTEGGMYERGEDLRRIIDSTHSQKYIPAQSLEFFYYFDHPQYAPIRNKRVLIIISHFYTIQHQLDILNSLFPKPIFESCEFAVLKPPQQCAGSSDRRSWRVHMDDFERRVRQLHEAFKFDTALVSCGGFGMPICDFIHTKLGSSAIYVGGGLQLFFGILGSRWADNPTIQKLRNSSWRFPLDSDKPANCQLVEGGCYW